MPAPAPVAPGPLVPGERPEWTLGSMVGRSPLIRRLFSQMQCTARHLGIATIEGESGTGKMLAAQTLHDIGPASAAPFLPCPAVQFFQHGPSLASLTPLNLDRAILRQIHLVLARVAGNKLRAAKMLSISRSPSILSSSPAGSIPAAPALVSRSAII